MIPCGGNPPSCVCCRTSSPLQGVAFFLNMSVRIMSEVFERSKTQGNARLVLLSLADSCNDDASCWPSIRKIAEKANISEPITKKYLNALIQIGVITRDEREDFSGRQTSNLYTIIVEKIGDDEITQNVIHQVTSPSRLKTFKGLTAVNVGGDNCGEVVVGVTKVSLPIMNHHKEPKIEPSRESSAVASHSSEVVTQPNLFSTNPSEANASGSANAKLNSADGNGTTPPIPLAPPRTRNPRATQIEKPSGVSEQVWNDFIALRKAKRAPLSATALSVIAKEAEKAAMHIEEALTECVTRGWQSFKAEWMKPKTTAKPERFANF